MIRFDMNITQRLAMQVHCMSMSRPYTEQCTSDHAAHILLLGEVSPKLLVVHKLCICNGLPGHADCGSETDKP